MKRLIILAIVLMVSMMVSPCFAEEGCRNCDDTEEVVEAEKSLCPITKMDSLCLTCHIAPSFKLKEVDPTEQYNDIPGGTSGVRILNGKLYPYYKLDYIVSESLKSFFEYISWHPEFEKHVIIEVFSPGGSLLDAWRIVGIMNYWKTKGYVVETRCYGFAASAGFVIFANGSKGFRYASPTAELMWHELWVGEWFKISTPSSSYDEAMVLRHIQDTISEFLSANSNLSKEEWDEKVHKKEYWINGNQALEIGISDGFPK